MKTCLGLLIIALTFATGCATKTVNIDPTNDDGKAVMQLDYRDFAQAATDMIQSCVASGTLNRQDGSRYVMAKGKIVNDTMQRIDTDQLMVKIEEELTNSGKVLMTAAMGATDDMVYEARKARDNEEFNQGTVAEKGQLVAPDLSVSGKIIQRNITYDKKTTQVEYYFQLRITTIKTGLTYWQKEVFVGKRGSNKSVTW